MEERGGMQELCISEAFLCWLGPRAFFADLTFCMVGIINCFRAYLNIWGRGVVKFWEHPREYARLSNAICHMCWGERLETMVCLDPCYSQCELACAFTFNLILSSMYSETALKIGSRKECLSLKGKQTLPWKPSNSEIDFLPCLWILSGIIF